MSDIQLFKDIDRYIEKNFGRPDSVLLGTLKNSDAAGLPRISITANQGRLLYLLARISGAKRILEIGLLGGYSTIWLARSLPAGGQLVSLELEEKHAQVARKNLVRAKLEKKVDIRVGPALKLLQQMVKQKEPAIDFIFIDADKVNYPHYLKWSLKLSRQGTVIIGDNVIRNGAVLKAKAANPDVAGTKKFNQLLSSNPKLESILVPCIKESIDGFSLARVK